MNDAGLVLASLGGDRDAFGHIVSRYQSLLCSLAYSSIGDLNHSEDVAQEAFVEAWGKLDTLKEPDKLKAWLCGILRFKVSRFRRKEANQPVKNAEVLEEDRGHGARDTKTEDAVIRDEEQVLLWEAMENVPDTYREALVLFYREDRSTKQVAEDLDLTEDAVKQRLSRGRKLLQAEMTRFVEGALEKSKPGATFTAAVLAVISAIPPPAQAASAGAVAAKAAHWLKWTNLLTLLAAFSGVISAFFGLRASLDQSRTQAERRRIIRIVTVMFFYPVLFCAALFGLRQLALHSGLPVHQVAIASQVLVLGFAASYVFLSVVILNGLRMLRAQQRELFPESFKDEVDQVGSKAREVKSKTYIAGVPLFHFRFGAPEKDDAPVVGWIAGGGDRAYGLLFAWGGIAVAPVSVGIVSFGLFSIGAVGFGLFGVGAVGIGIIGFGSAAVAYKAYASLSALGWSSAFSPGISVAKEAAIGPVAYAEHVNNELAFEIASLAAMDQVYLWILGAIAALVIIPAAWHSNTVRKRMRK
ncbi:MAG: sigma-70 family RNA polymerase sigma factor [Woeseiaceae bacterium]|nr:sigma-70 family RNA polymerase sigma factor [Woeseiaceae bacterium]